MRLLLSLSTGLSCVAALALAACQGLPVEEESAGSESAFTESHLLAAPTWASCWTERWELRDASVEHRLVCKHEAIDREQPIVPPILFAYATDKDGRHVGSKNLRDATGENVILAQLRAEQFPIKLQLSSTDSNEVVGFRTNASLRRTVEIAAPNITQDQPLLFKQPFDVWRVVVVKKTDVVVASLSGTASIAPFAFAESTEEETRTKLRIESTDPLPAVGPSVLVGYAAAPREGKLEGPYVTVAGQTQATIEAPGVFVAEENGLRPATEEERAGIRIPLPRPLAAGAAAPDASADGGTD
jgi:hypothetical protein